MDAAAAPLMQKFAEYGGLLGLIVGVLLVQLIYMQATMSKRLTDLTDRILGIVAENTRALARADDAQSILVRSLEKRRCLEGEHLAEQIRAREQERAAAAAAKQSAA